MYYYPGLAVEALYCVILAFLEQHFPEFPFLWGSWLVLVIVNHEIWKVDIKEWPFHSLRVNVGHQALWQLLNVGPDQLAHYLGVETPGPATPVELIRSPSLFSLNLESSVYTSLRQRALAPLLTEP